MFTLVNIYSIWTYYDENKYIISDFYPFTSILVRKILLFFSCVADVLSFQPEFAEPIVNISVAVGRDSTFTCHVRHLGGYRVSKM